MIINDFAAAKMKRASFKDRNTRFSHGFVFGNAACAHFQFGTSRNTRGCAVVVFNPDTAQATGSLGNQIDYTI